MITLKKYPNRRIYDTSISQYITLDDVRDMVISGEDLVVVDSKSGKDLTRNTLLQIVMETEQDPQYGLLSKKTLQALIYMHSAPNKEKLVPILEHFIGAASDHD